MSTKVAIFHPLIVPMSSGPLKWLD